MQAKLPVATLSEPGVFIMTGGSAKGFLFGELIICEIWNAKDENNNDFVGFLLSQRGTTEVLDDIVTTFRASATQEMKQTMKGLISSPFSQWNQL